MDHVLEAQRLESNPCFLATHQWAVYTVLRWRVLIHVRIQSEARGTGKRYGSSYLGHRHEAIANLIKRRSTDFLKDGD